MAVLLSARDLEKSFGAHVLFQGLSLAFHDNESVGLIGPNGAGKSTLLKILAGSEPCDLGTIEIARGKHVAYLAQEDRFDNGITAFGALKQALSALPLDEHEIDSGAAIMASKLGFENPDVKADTLSGGWRKRLAIGCKLIVKPDLLLLDEPTNHLDLAGIAWLESFLNDSGTAFVMISHDRYFLENVCSRIVEINRRYPEGFYSVPGKYSDFLESREAWLTAEQRREQRLANVVRQEIEWLRRGPQGRRCKAVGKIKQAHQKIDALSDVRDRLSGRDPVQIDFAATGRKTQDLIIAQQVGHTLGGNRLLNKLDVQITPATRLGIVGNNGSGKTTLLKILAKELQQDEGNVRHVTGLRTAVFDQKREKLNPEDTLRRALAPDGDTVLVQGKGMHVVGWAQRFLFRTDQLESKLSTLSGGERARVMLAALMRQEADVLFLDEPTNDLDIPSIEMLEVALAEFNGAVVVISHDRNLLEKLCTEFVGLHPGGGCGIYTDLWQWQAAEDRARVDLSRQRKAEKSAQKKTNTDETVNAQTDNKSGTAKAGLSKEEEREWRQMERKILSAEEKLETLQKQLNDPAIVSNREKMHALCTELGETQTEVEQLYERWQELDNRR